MAENTFKLHIVTPDKSFYDDEVSRVMFKSTEGDIAVLYDHIPLTTTLVSGMAIIYKDNKEYPAVLHGGFAEIKEESVTILSDAAEWPDDIDLDRANAAKERAQSRSQEQEEQISQARVNASLMRAVARIDLLEYHKNKSNE
ncbi:MAG: ATP synthase F1 subunit epsilon [Firmicutes bacterium HGW-Firmicutes-1]|jgi:F-type H+-transporting ATPase subunit epsilon|nr:MAG: ATP synthase F1 subunit epsilon [Firmicutes bacterium HGW-Firmicutes-1]